MARIELGEITEISILELKQIFSGGLIIRPQVDRSTVTQAGQAFLSKGFDQKSFYASP
jgi:hypothetical protein